LNEELHSLLLRDVNQHFSDLLTSGEFTQRASLSEEKDEKDLAHLPRLVFRFNRRDLGRLRQLIDCINRGSVNTA
jgi:hypothetical protein